MQIESQQDVEDFVGILRTSGFLDRLGLDAADEVAGLGREFAAGRSLWFGLGGFAVLAQRYRVISPDAHESFDGYLDEDRPALVCFRVQLEHVCSMSGTTLEHVDVVIDHAGPTARFTWTCSGFRRASGTSVQAVDDGGYIWSALHEAAASINGTLADAEPCRFHYLGDAADPMQAGLAFMAEREVRALTDAGVLRRYGV